MMRTALLAILLAAPASAAVVQQGPTGFVSENRATIAKPPAEVWAALVKWGSWWDPAHSYSGAPDRIALEPRAGGQLREDWDGGSVVHATVMAAMPPALLRLEGGFGPLQSLPVQAVMEFALKPAGAGTDITMRYSVGGPPQTGLPQMAAPVDAVMSAGFARLVRLAGTGRIEETR